jgi:hypothetical protein
MAVGVVDRLVLLAAVRVLQEEEVAGPRVRLCGRGHPERDQNTQGVHPQVSQREGLINLILMDSFCFFLEGCLLSI